MGSQTSLVARQYRLREWAEQIQECKNRPAEVTVAQWCDQHDITTSNFYYRQREVRKAILTTVQNSSLEQECQEIPFVDILEVAAKPPANHKKESSDPAAVIHCNSYCIELYNSAEPSFIQSILETLSNAQ